MVSRQSSHQLLAYYEILYNLHIKYDFMPNVCIAIWSTLCVNRLKNVTQDLYRQEALWDVKSLEVLSRAPTTTYDILDSPCCLRISPKQFQIHGNMMDHSTHHYVTNHDGCWWQGVKTPTSSDPSFGQCLSEIAHLYSPCYWLQFSETVVSMRCRNELDLGIN